MAKQTGDQYKVVVNHEEQYQVIPLPQRIPKGYRQAVVAGTRDECLAYVKKAWKGATPQEWKKLLDSIG